jgi:hypothetical protein
MEICPKCHGDCEIVVNGKYIPCPECPQSMGVILEPVTHGEMSSEWGDV